MLIASINWIVDWIALISIDWIAIDGFSSIFSRFFMIIYFTIIVQHNTQIRQHTYALF